MTNKQKLKEYKIWLYPNDNKKLKDYAKKVGKSMSELIRTFIQNLVLSSNK